MKAFSKPTGAAALRLVGPGAWTAPLLPPSLTMESRMAFGIQTSMHVSRMAADVAASLTVWDRIPRDMLDTVYAPFAAPLPMTAVLSPGQL